MPQWYEDEPQEQPFDSFYLGSFWDLNSTRRYDLGPIPWDCAVSYAQHTGLKGEVVDHFTALILRMDQAYLGWVAEQKKT